MEISEETKKQLLGYQENEITEYHIYRKLAAVQKNPGNRRILEEIADDEKKHYEQWKAVTGREVAPRKLSVLKFYWICRILGITFGLKLMERGEKLTQQVYAQLQQQLPELADVLMDEQKHENQVLNLIEEQRIAYAGSIVLGLNDALVELTGALAGLTFALQNSRLIAMTGFITGVAAAMSMATSEYLSSREEADEKSTKHPRKSAAYTGVTYFLTVLILILPYLVLPNVYAAFGTMTALSILIILAYNFYIATAKDTPLWRRFATMAAISLGVAAISFLVGIAARTLFGVQL